MQIDLNKMQLSVLIVALEDYINKKNPEKDSSLWGILDYLYGFI